MNRRRALVAAAGLLLAAAGCASLAGLTQKPELTLIGARVTKFNLAEQQLALRLRVRNPNPVALPLDRLDFALDINGQPFARGNSEQPLVVPGGGEGVLEVSARSDLASLAALYNQLRTLPAEARQRLDYRLSGTLVAGAFGRVPFDRSGEIDLKSADFALRVPDRP